MQERTLIFSISLTIILFNAGAQPAVIVKGIIKDKGTNEPIPFASVSLVDSNRGTSANESGEFSLPCLPGDRQVKISCIGYKTRIFSIIRSVDQTPVFELDPEVVELGEMEITQSRIDPLEIIQSAIDSIHVNYKTDSFNLEFLSCIKAVNTMSQKEFVVESIVRGYYEGYASGKKKFEIITKRTRGEDPLKMKRYPYWPTLEIHRGDLITDPEKTGIFNKKNLEKFEFKYNGALIYDTDTVYHISYVAPRPTQKITGYGVVPKVYKGEIFITTQTHAVVRHDLSTDQFQHSIIYRKIGHHYFPYSISGERQLSSDAFTKVANVISMTNVSLDDVKVIQQRTNEFDELDSIVEDTAYWDSTFPARKD